MVFGNSLFVGQTVVAVGFSAKLFGLRPILFVVKAFSDDRFWHFCRFSQLRNDQGFLNELEKTFGDDVLISELASVFVAV